MEKYIIRFSGHAVSVYKMNNSYTCYRDEATRYDSIEAAIIAAGKEQAQIQDADTYSFVAWANY